MCYDIMWTNLQVINPKVTAISNSGVLSQIITFSVVSILILVKFSKLYEKLGTWDKKSKKTKRQTKAQKENSTVVAAHATQQVHSESAV